MTFAFTTERYLMQKSRRSIMKVAGELQLTFCHKGESMKFRDVVYTGSVLTFVLIGTEVYEMASTQRREPRIINLSSGNRRNPINSTKHNHNEIQNEARNYRGRFFASGSMGSSSASFSSDIIISKSN